MGLYLQIMEQILGQGHLCLVIQQGQGYSLVVDTDMDSASALSRLWVLYVLNMLSMTSKAKGFILELVIGTSCLTGGPCGHYLVFSSAKRRK
ncbi:hypothetical protein AKJ16_DCAP03520 [Drosera capensis]